MLHRRRWTALAAAHVHRPIASSARSACLFGAPTMSINLCGPVSSSSSSGSVGTTVSSVANARGQAPGVDRAGVDRAGGCHTRRRQLIRRCGGGGAGWRRRTNGLVQDAPTRMAVTPARMTSQTARKRSTARRRRPLRRRRDDRWARACEGLATVTVN